MKDNLGYLEEEMLLINKELSALITKNSETKLYKNDYEIDRSKLLTL